MSKPVRVRLGAKFLRPNRFQALGRIPPPHALINDKKKKVTLIRDESVARSGESLPRNSASVFSNLHKKVFCVDGLFVANGPKKNTVYRSSNSFPK